MRPPFRLKTKSGLKARSFLLLTNIAALSRLIIQVRNLKIITFSEVIV